MTYLLCTTSLHLYDISKRSHLNVKMIWNLNRFDDKKDYINFYFALQEKYAIETNKKNYFESVDMHHLLTTQCN